MRRTEQLLRANGNSRWTYEGPRFIGGKHLVKIGDYVVGEFNLRSEAELAAEAPAYAAQIEDLLTERGHLKPELESLRIEVQELRSKLADAALLDRETVHNQVPTTETEL